MACMFCLSAFSHKAMAQDMTPWGGVYNYPYFVTTNAQKAEYRAAYNAEYATAWAEKQDFVAFIKQQWLPFETYIWISGTKIEIGTTAIETFYAYFWGTSYVVDTNYYWLTQSLLYPESPSVIGSLDGFRDAVFFSDWE